MDNCIKIISVGLTYHRQLYYLDLLLKQHPTLHQTLGHISYLTGLYIEIHAD